MVKLAFQCFGDVRPAAGPSSPYHSCCLPDVIVKYLYPISEVKHRKVSASTIIVGLFNSLRCFSFSVKHFSTLGFNDDNFANNGGRVRQFMNHCTGLLSRDCIGVFRYSNTASHTSVFACAAFLINDSAVFD